MNRFSRFVNRSITRRLLIYFLAISLVPLITLQAITILANEQTMTNVMLRSTEAEVSSALANMELSFSRVLSICDSIQNDTTFQKRMRGSYDTLESRYSEDLAGDMDLASMMGTHKDIYGLYLLGANRLCCKSNTNSFISDDYRNDYWFSDTLARRSASWTSFHEESYVVKTSMERFISYCSPYVDKATGRVNGVIVVDIEEKTLTSSISQNMQDKSFFLLLDSNNELLYQTENESASSTLLQHVITRIAGTAAPEGDDNCVMLVDDVCLIVYQESPTTGWQLVGVTPMDTLNATRDTNIWLAVFMCVLFTLLALLLAYYLSDKFTSPILQLKSAMKALEEGDLSISLVPAGQDEMSDLTRSFNHMVNQLHELVNSVYEQQNKLRKSEFKALQAQINPHFLYNSLDSIVWLLRMERTGDAISMLQNLTTLFRISLSKGRELIPLRAELRHLRSYLAIEAMRYSRKFEATIQADDALLEYTSLKLMLQPLVENCIYHSISLEKPFIHIRIVVEEQTDTLLFRVQDDGIGMTPDALQTLREKIAVTSAPHSASEPVEPYSDSGGYGLKNVNERIKIYFGEEYGITITSEVNAGTSVNICIPKMHGHDS